MNVRAIVLVGPPAESSSGHEQLAGVPLSLLDVLGRPVLHRVLEQVRARVDEVAVVIAATTPEAAQAARQAAVPGIAWTVAGEAEEMWRSAEQTFSDFAQNGAEAVIAIRVGPYAEIDLDHMVQFHLDQGARVTAAVREEREFGVFVISASRRNDAAYLFRHRFTECRVPCTRYRFDGYYNDFASAADLRALTSDALMQRNLVRPAGREARPGIWLGERARIDRGARLLAPAFVGARSRIRAGAVVTRCSAVEHHTEVDCGSVIEEANILPFTCVGAGLDICNAIVGSRRLFDLRRHTVVEFADDRLIGMSSRHAPVRALGTATSLPKHFFRGLFGKPRRESSKDMPAAAHVPAAALESPALSKTAEQKSAEFPSTLAVARRYGNE